MALNTIRCCIQSLNNTHSEVMNMSSSIYSEMFPDFPCFLFTPDELSQAKSRDRMPCKCANCGKEFWKEKHFLQRNIKDRKPLIYCSYECAISHRQKLAEERIPDTYVCEYCGKTVDKKNAYGSCRFCCEECCRKYSNQFAISEESNKKRSEKLKKYHEEHKSVKKIHKKKKLSTSIKKPRKAKITQSKITSSSIKEMQKYWCLGDIIRKCKTTYLTLKKICNEENYSLDKKYIPLTNIKIISACRYALAKPVELGSITYDDLKCVSDICSELLYKYNWSSERICTDFLGVYLPFRGSFSPTFLLKKMGVKTKSISESTHSYYIRNKLYKNKQPKKKYKTEGLFHFERKLYNLLFEFTDLTINSWRKDKIHPELNSTSRDHMISQDYGYTHHIDPYLISHPANCMLMKLSDNIRKRTECSITLGELIERVEFFNETILRQDEISQYEINYKVNPKLSYKELKHYLNLSMID